MIMKSGGYIMSYELDYENKHPCPCTKGYIVETSSSNDWNQVESHVNIECSECCSKYHIENLTSIRGDQVNYIPVLVPNGETLLRNNSFNIYKISFPEQLCRSRSLETLKHVYEVLCSSTTYSKISDESTRKIVRECKSVHNTIKISSVKGYVLDAIKEYNNFEINYDKDTERIKETRKKIISIYK